MSLVHDPAKPIPFQPRKDGPTYLLRVPTVADRARYRHALRTAGAVFHNNLRLMEIAKAGLNRLVPGEDGDDGRALLDAYLKRLRTAIEGIQAAKTEESQEEFNAALVLSDKLVEMCNLLEDRDPPFARAVADNVVYHLRAGTQAAKLFLVGWEGLGEFKSGLLGPDEATLAQISSDDMILMGLHIEELLEPSEARMGNSASPSSGRPKGGNSRISSATRPKGRSTAVPETASI